MNKRDDGFVSGSTATWILAGRRHRTQTALLNSSGPLPGGGLPLLLTLIVTGCAALGLLYTALR